MWFKSNKDKVKVLLMKDKMQGEYKKADIQHHIQTATGCIPESIQRHPFFNGRIKKINQRSDTISDHKNARKGKLFFSGLLLKKIPAQAGITFK